MYILKLLFWKEMSVNSDVVLDMSYRQKKGMLSYDIDPEALIRELILCHKCSRDFTQYP